MQIFPSTNHWVFRIIYSIMTLAVLAFTTILVIAAYVVYEINRPHSHASEHKVITIEKGANTKSIIAQLHEEGVLASRWPVWLWMRLVINNESFKAGDYSFTSPIAPRKVIDKLLRGEIATNKFTIPEGYNQFDIARVISQLKGIDRSASSDLKVVENLLKDTSLIADLDPEAENLEGYLFPDTYEYSSSSTPKQLVEIMVKRFRNVYSKRLQEQAEKMGMTTRKVITLASLIEKEARIDEERELISSVFHRRLKVGMPLACDPTVIYAAILAGRYRGKIYQSDLDRDSPYNTYKKAGLPPGPIASPGKRSIESALNPAQTDYLFFVVDAEKQDGSHKFSASLADHDKAVKVLRESERAPSINLTRENKER